MNRLNDMFAHNESRNDKTVSIGSVKLRLRNYLYLTMLKSFTGIEDIDINDILDTIVDDFISTHKDDFIALKNENKRDGSDWLVDILFGD